MVRKAALWNLYHLEPAVLLNRYASAIAARIEDSDWMVRKVALEILQAPELLCLYADAVVARLKDDVWIIRMKAASMLTGLGPTMLEKYVDTLSALLKDDIFEVRAAAVRTLSEIESARPLTCAEIVYPLLKDAHCDVRGAAVGFYHNAASWVRAMFADDIAEMLNDVDRMVQGAALELLGSLDPELLTESGYPWEGDNDVWDRGVRALQATRDAKLFAQVRADMADRDPKRSCTEGTSSPASEAMDAAENNSTSQANGSEAPEAVRSSQADHVPISQVVERATPDCPICLEPKQLDILPCEHGVCSTCLQQHIETFREQQEQNAGTSGHAFDLDNPPPQQLMCPTCRADFQENEVEKTSVPERLRDVALSSAVPSASEMPMAVENMVGESIEHVGISRDEPTTLEAPTEESSLTAIGETAVQPDLPSTGPSQPRAAEFEAPASLEALVAGAQEARAAWETAVEAVVQAQVEYDAHVGDVSKRSGELAKREKTAAKQKEGSENARKLNAECGVLAKGLEAAQREKEQAHVRLDAQQAEERRCNDALDTAVAALNDADTLRRGKPDKWRELHTHGGTILLESERPLQLPSVTTVGRTAFRSIFNHGFDKNGDPVKCPDGVGDRWHGRKAESGEDAEWVVPFDAGVSAWLGEGDLSWLATTTRPCTKEVKDTHALKAGVDSRGKNATTPEQTPLHADSCWPNSHVAARAPWGDAHLVMIVALQDGTQLPIYPFHKGGEREIVELNAGDAFVFRGDLIHIGAEYSSLNIRIHCYIDSPCAPEVRDPDKTYYLLEDSWPIVRR